MSTLVLELRQGDLMIVNGAPIRFRNRARIELTSRARFLFGKQIMAPEDTTSPARRIYFAVQTAYIGNEEEREQGLDLARDLIEEFRCVTTSVTVQELLERILTLAENDDCYQALKLLRRVMQHEDAVFGQSRATPPSEDAA